MDHPPDNLRYAFDVCLFSYPKTPVDGFLNTPCNIQDNCGALKDKLTSSLDPDSDDHYGYCEDDKQLGTNATYTGCLKCLQATASQNYYANCKHALHTAIYIHKALN